MTTMLVKKKETCVHCKKPIDLSKDLYVRVTTANRTHPQTHAKLPDIHDYFHSSCWIDFFNKSVQKRMERQMQEAQKGIFNLFNSPMIKNMMPQLSGMFKSMGFGGIFPEEKKELTQIDIISTAKDVETKIKEKIDDDREKREKEKREGRRKSDRKQTE